MTRLRIAQTLGTRLRSSAGRSVVGSLAASVGLQLLVVVSGVLVARSLGPEDRGYLALLIVIAGVLALLGTLGLPTATTYYLAQDPSRARRIASSLTWVGVLQVGTVLVLQTAVLAALVATNRLASKSRPQYRFSLPPGILALSFGLAILQGQRQFTAFNLLRILPSAAYVAGVVAIYTLNAQPRPFMALWAGVNFVGGFFALVVAVRGSPKHGEPARAVRAEMRGSDSRRSSERCRQSIPFASIRPSWPPLQPCGPRALCRCSGIHATPRVVAASIGRSRIRKSPPNSTRTARRAMWNSSSGTRVLGVVVAALELMGARSSLSSSATNSPTRPRSPDPPRRVSVRRRPASSYRWGQRPWVSRLRDDRRNLVVDPAPPRPRGFPPLVRSRRCRAGARDLLGSEPSPSDTSCSWSRRPCCGGAGEAYGSHAASGRLPAIGPRSSRLSVSQELRSSPCWEVTVAFFPDRRSRAGHRAGGRTRSRLWARSTRRAHSITRTTRGGSSRLAASS